MLPPGPLEDAPYAAAVESEFANTIGPIIWHERHGDRAVAIKWLEDSAREWAVLLEKIDDLWLPIRNSLFHELTYEDDPTHGVWFMTEPIISPVEAVRIKYGSVTLERPVVHGCLNIVLWDTPIPKNERVTFSEIRVNGTWQPPLTPNCAETRETFVRDYYRHYDKTISAEEKDRLFWTWDIIEGNHDEAELDLAFAIIDAADINNEHHQFVLGCLGAGPLENMMSHWLLDRVAHRLPHDARLACALNTIYIQYEPEDVQRRFQAVMSGQPDPGNAVLPYDPMANT